MNLRLAVTLIWLSTAAVMLAGTWPAALDGSRWDTDDAMRWVQVFDLVDAGRWTDTMQHRLQPPEGVDMHWSRLPDLPLAAGLLLASLWLPRQEAAALVGLAWPVAMLLPLLAILVASARTLMGRAQAPMAALVMIVSITGLMQFLPGRVDHHNWQLLLGQAVLLLLLLALALPRRRAAMLAGAGIVLACALAIGMEALMLVVAFNATLALAWILGWPRRLARPALAGAAALCLSAFGLLAVSGRLTSVACDALSQVPAGFALFCAVFWAGMALLEPRLQRPVHRIAAAGVGAALGLAATLAAFPHCLSGGYSGLDAVAADVWLSSVAEAQPITALWASKPEFVASALATPLLAVAVTTRLCLTAPPRRRVLYVSLAVFMAVPLALTFWQLRTVMFAQLFATLPVAWAVCRLAAWVRRHSRLQRVAGAGTVVAALLLVGPLPLLARAGAQPTEPVTVPAASCRSAPWFAQLRDLPPGRGLSGIDLAPFLLFHTNHAVLAGPYHRGDRGIRETIEIFRAPAETPHPILAQRGIAWIAICPSAAEMRLYAVEGTVTLSDRLQAGNPPPWLKQLPTVPGSPLRVFEVTGQQ